MSDSYIDLMNEIEENSKDGYATAIFGENGKAIVWGKMVSDRCELPDSPANCSLMIHSGPDCEAMQTMLADYEVLD